MNGGDSGSEPRNKKVVERLFDEVWNGRKLGAIGELYAPEFVVDYRPYAPLAHGPEAVQAMVQRCYETFPDYHEELLRLVAEADTVVVHMRITGTQLGAWGPAPPTGRRVEFEEIAILTFREGKVVHQRGIVDNLAALRQLGVVPTPPS